MTIGDELPFRSTATPEAGGFGRIIAIGAASLLSWVLKGVRDGVATALFGALIEKVQAMLHATNVDLSAIAAWAIQQF